MQLKVTKRSFNYNRAFLNCIAVTCSLISPINLSRGGASLGVHPELSLEGGLRVLPPKKINF